MGEGGEGGGDRLVQRKVIIGRVAGEGVCVCGGGGGGAGELIRGELQLVEVSQSLK